MLNFFVMLHFVNVSVMLVLTTKHQVCVAILLDLVSNQRYVEFGHKYPDLVEGMDDGIYL
jgi:hypothetical protein